MSSVAAAAAGASAAAASSVTKDVVVSVARIGERLAFKPNRTSLYHAGECLITLDMNMVALVNIFSAQDVKRLAAVLDEPTLHATYFSKKNLTYLVRKAVSIKSWPCLQLILARCTFSARHRESTFAALSLQAEKELETGITVPKDQVTLVGLYPPTDAHTALARATAQAAKAAEAALGSKALSGARYTARENAKAQVRAAAKAEAEAEAEAAEGASAAAAAAAGPGPCKAKAARSSSISQQHLHLLRALRDNMEPLLMHAMPLEMEQFRSRANILFRTVSRNTGAPMVVSHAKVLSNVGPLVATMLFLYNGHADAAADSDARLSISESELVQLATVDAATANVSIPRFPPVEHLFGAATRLLRAQLKIQNKEREQMRVSMGRDIYENEALGDSLAYMLEATNHVHRVMVHEIVNLLDDQKYLIPDLANIVGQYLSVDSEEVAQADDLLSKDELLQQIFPPPPSPQKQNKNKNKKKQRNPKRKRQQGGAAAAAAAAAEEEGEGDDGGEDADGAENDEQSEQEDAVEEMDYSDAAAAAAGAADEEEQREETNYMENASATGAAAAAHAHDGSSSMASGRNRKQARR